MLTFPVPGVLLCVLPSLANLQYTIKELHRGYAVIDSIPAFFGISSLPVALGANLATTLHEIGMSDLSFLRSMAFEKLKVLTIPSLTVPTLLQLNGPNTFRGTTQLSDLSVGLSVFLMDKACVDDMTVGFRDLIEALGCLSLNALKIRLEHETYCALHIPPAFDVQFFMDQLSHLRPTLKTLEIDMNPKEGPDEWEFIIAHCENPVSSLKRFTALNSLKIPQNFLFTTLGDDPQTLPQDLPRKLRNLEIVSPDRQIVAWAKHLLDRQTDATKVCTDLRNITLYCRNDVASSAITFTRKVQSVWSDLASINHITSYVHEFETQVTKCLPKLYENDPGESDDDDYWEDEADDDNGSSEDESDEDMPDLEPHQGPGTVPLHDDPFDPIVADVY